MSGRGSTVSERYRPTTNEKPSETMFQRVLLDFVLKTFGTWSGKRDSNSRPQPWQGCALPTELFPHFCLRSLLFKPSHCQGWIYYPSGARLCSTNWAISAKIVNVAKGFIRFASANIRQKNILCKKIWKKLQFPLKNLCKKRCFYTLWCGNNRRCRPLVFAQPPRKPATAPISNTHRTYHRRKGGPKNRAHPRLSISSWNTPTPPAPISVSLEAINNY